MSDDFFKKEKIKAKEIAVDVVSTSVTLLNPNIWQNPETVIPALWGAVTGFGARRVKSLFTDIDHAGNIEEDVLKEEKTEQVLLDLANFAVKDNPDIDTWNAAKKIFIKTLQKDTKENDRQSLYEMISICKGLSGMEIQIIAAAHSLSKADTNRFIERWADLVAERIGLQTREEVLRYEENLVSQKLIAPAEILRGDKLTQWTPGIKNQNRNRLTALGSKFADALSV